MLGEIFLLFVGLAALTVGAEGLVRGSASLAARIGLTPLVIGLTVVAFGTSTPELVVSLAASLNGQSDIAIGNVIGSNTFNIGIILGLTALLCPVKVNLQVIRRDAPIMIAVSLLALILVTMGTISRWTGTGLILSLVAYTAYSVWLAKKEVSAEIKQQFQEGITPPSKSLHRDLLFICGGLLLLVAGSRLLVESAIEIARVVGVSEAVIGLTIIAAGTSMPELATSAIAALRRQPDIAVGNVVGSNIFNILGILGAASVASPLSASGITRLDLLVMVVFSVAFLPLLYTGLKLQKWEGLLLLTGYGVYLWVLWPSA